MQTRHVSYLFGLHPGRQITQMGTPALFEAAKRTLGLRGDGGMGWSKGWKINSWARLEDGNHAFKMLTNMLNLVEHNSTICEKCRVYANLFDVHLPFQIDENVGATVGMAEMLLQSHTARVLGLDLLWILHDLMVNLAAPVIGSRFGNPCQFRINIPINMWNNYRQKNVNTQRRPLSPLTRQKNIDIRWPP